MQMIIMKINIFIFILQILLILRRTFCKENLENCVCKDCGNELKYTVTKVSVRGLKEFLLEYNSISQSSNHSKNFMSNNFDIKELSADYNANNAKYFKNQINLTHLIPIKEEKVSNNDFLKNILTKKNKSIEIASTSKSIDKAEFHDREKAEIRMKTEINPQILNNITIFNGFTTKNLITNAIDINFDEGKSTDYSNITNSTSHSNDTSNVHIKKVFVMNIYNEVCNCDLILNECDINCCCDKDCSTAMKEIFTSCEKFTNHVNSNKCYDSKLLFKNNFKNKVTENRKGLFCLVKNNLNPQLLFKEQPIMESVKSFKNNLMGKKLFTFSKQFEKLKMQNKPYRVGDYLWSIEKNEFIPFGVPQYVVNMKCNSMKNIQYLTDYLTKCIHSVPKNKNECENAIDLTMLSYLKKGKIIKSPHLLVRSNSSHTDKLCTNETCIFIESYICSEGLDGRNCVKAKPKKPIWNNHVCENVATSIDYYVYHNGSNGIKEMRAHFVLNNISSGNNKELIQSIKVKFLWAESTEHTFVRSGNPGYLIGRPIMAGRKIYYNNETAASKKEAIQVALDSKYWLTVFGTKTGICSDNRRTVNFGENIFYRCSIFLEKFDFLKSKCIGLQENIFNFLIGDDYRDIKVNNRFNKFVATYANSSPEETSDWVQVIIDTLLIVSNQSSFTSHLDNFLCKNIFTDLYIDVAYTKLGSFGKPQAKILGVYFHFGPPAEVMYFRNSSDKSHQTVKISTFLQFIDLTNKPVKEFAEPPGFEAKLPHDFFYPFFSEGSLSRPLYYLLIVALLSLFFISSIQKNFIS